MKNLVLFLNLFITNVIFSQCDMEIISFNEETMDISICVNSGVNCGSPTDSIGEFLLGITTDPQLEEYPYSCFYDGGWALLVYPVNFMLVDINSPGPYLQTGDTITFNVVDAFVTGSDASLCWEEAINDGFFQDYCWILAITQINDSYTFPYEDSGLGDFEYPDVNSNNNITQFSPFDPYCNPDYNGEPDPCYDPYVFIPNSFSPNGDGKNESFKPIIQSSPECWLYWEFTVYNRWGGKVFESNYPGQQWLGDVNGGNHYASDGVYVWTLRARHKYGETYQIHGHITLFR